MYPSRLTRTQSGAAPRPPGARRSGMAGGRLVPSWRVEITPRASLAVRGCNEEWHSMIHVTCDLCGKSIRSGKDPHYVVKVEVFVVHEPPALTEDDLDEDHLEAVSQLLCEMEE